MRLHKIGRTIGTLAVVLGIAGITGGVANGGLNGASGLLTPGAQAQTTQPIDYAEHPIVGAWLVTTPIGPSLAVFSADGTNIQGVPAAQAGPEGVTFTGAQVGTWEPIDDRGIHFTGVQLHTDANGTFTGTVTIDGHPRVSDDGQSFIDDAPETTVTIRDAANNIVTVIPGPPNPPAIGIRMAVGAPGFPESGAANATPGS